AMWLLWPWMSLMSLMIFRWSMRCARIRPIHVQRCCLYSFDGLWWAGLLLLATAIVEGAVAGSLRILGVGGGEVPGHEFSCQAIGWMARVFGAWKLRQASTYYLRFDRPGGLDGSGVADPGDAGPALCLAVCLSGRTGRPDVPT